MSLYGNPSSRQEAAEPAPDRWAHDYIAGMMTCPLCFGQVAKHHTRENRGIILATYVCENQHLFDVRWGLAQGEVAA